jgi:outer membrane protein assembly factor BamB
VTIVRTTLLLLAAALPVQADPAEGWPSARGGETRCGVTAEPVLGLTPGQFGLAWRRALGAPVAAAPIIAGGRVIVGDTAGTLHAIDLETGCRAWAVRLPAPVLAAASRAGDVVLVPCSDGRLTARALRDGAERWTVALPGGIETAPAVLGLRAFVATRTGVLLAIDLSAEGAVVWKRSVGAPVFASPAAAGSRVVVLPVNGALQCVSAADGTPRWEADLGPEPCYAPPAVDRGEVVVVSGAGICAAFDLAGGKRRYRVALGARVSAAPAVCADRIAVVTEEGRCRVLDREDGSALWHRSSPFNAGPYRAGVVAGPGWMFVASTRGRIHIQSLDSPTSERTAVHPMSAARRTGSLRVAPALHRHGFAGVRSDGLLFAYREAAGDDRLLRVVLGLTPRVPEETLEDWIDGLTDPAIAGRSALALCRHGHAAADALARHLRTGSAETQAAARTLQDHLAPFLTLSGAVRSHLAASKPARQKLWRACLAHRDPAVARAAVARWPADADTALLEGFDPGAPVAQRRAFVAKLPR